MTNDKTDPSTLTGGYALNAVSAEERAAVEAHMRASQAARNEVTELQDTAVLLGLAAEPVAPSADLKARLMAQIAVTPQLAPETADEGAVSSPTQPRLTAVPTAPDAASSPSLSDTASQPAPSRAQLKARSMWSRPLVGVAAVAAAIAIFFGGGVAITGVLTPTNNPAEQEAAAIAAIRAANDMQQKVVEDPEAGTSATVMWSGELAQAALIVNGMPKLDDDQDYELWYIGDDGPRAAGTFEVDDKGAATKVLEGDMRAGDVIGVTIEPEGGSDTPSGDPIMAVES